MLYFQVVPSARTLGIVKLPARIWAAIYVLLTMGFPGFGLIDLGVSVDPNRGAGFEGSQIVEGFWGLFFTVLVGVPFVSMVFRPHRSAPAMWQVLVSSAALAVAAVTVAEVGPMVWAVALALGVALVAGLTPDREPLRIQLGPLSQTSAAFGRDRRGPVGVVCRGHVYCRARAGTGGPRHGRIPPLPGAGRGRYCACRSHGVDGDLATRALLRWTLRSRGGDVVRRHGSRVSGRRCRAITLLERGGRRMGCGNRLHGCR